MRIFVAAIVLMVGRGLCLAQDHAPAGHGAAPKQEAKTDHGAAKPDHGKPDRGAVDHSGEHASGENYQYIGKYLVPKPDGTPNPTTIVTIALLMFAAAALVGPIVRAAMPAEAPVAHHDDHGSGHGHGAHDSHGHDAHAKDSHGHH